MSKAARIKLLALDTELEANRRAKLHKLVYVRKGGHRIAVHVNRSVSGYIAGADFESRTHTAWGAVPSHAIVTMMARLSLAMLAGGVK
nr:hypothetical protein [uncultured bacterium]